MNEINEEIIVRFLNGQLNNDETDVFEEWIHASKENANLFNSIRDLWLASAVYLKSENYDATRAAKKARWFIDWKKSRERSLRMNRRINTFYPLRSPRYPSFGRRHRAWMVYHHPWRECGKT